MSNEGKNWDEWRDNLDRQNQERIERALERCAIEERELEEKTEKVAQ